MVEQIIRLILILILGIIEKPSGGCDSKIWEVVMKAMPFPYFVPEAHPGFLEMEPG